MCLCTLDWLARPETGLVVGEEGKNPDIVLRQRRAPDNIRHSRAAAGPSEALGLENPVGLLLGRAEQA